MKRSFVTTILIVFALCWQSLASAQQAFHYLKADSIDAKTFPPPPSCGSMIDLGDLNCVLWVQDHRDRADIKRAKSEQYGFHFRLLADLLGPGFTKENLPKTAELLKNAGGDAEIFSETLKRRFRRPRPFVNHPNVDPVVETLASWSYPSGHSTGGTVVALILAQLIPERADQLKQWGCSFGWDRVIGGVHYPTDVVAGRDLGTMVVQKLLADEAFKKDLAACKDEIKNQEAFQRGLAVTHKAQVESRRSASSVMSARAANTPARATRPLLAE